MSARRFVVELVARVPLTRGVHQLRFVSLLPFHWLPGQHLVVVRGQGRELLLPYSIASAYDPRKPGEFELAVAVGAGADVMDGLPLGGELEVLEPAGEFTWQASPLPAALLVGAGTGIAPLRALIQAELQRESTTRVLLLAGHREAAHILFGDEFARLAAEHPRFGFLPTLTGIGDGWSGLRGRVQAQLSEAVRSLGPLDAYVCGRADMVRDVSAQLLREGVPAARVRVEGY